MSVDNFVRAESDMYFAKTAGEGAFGKLRHDRTPASVEDQKVVRMNRDTLYSSGVFDLSAGPITVTLRRQASVSFPCRSYPKTITSSRSRMSLARIVMTRRKLERAMCM